METIVTVTAITMRCPTCHNPMKARAHKSGGLSGKCTVCKSTIYSKQANARETHIRIVKQA